MVAQSNNRKTKKHINVTISYESGTEKSAPVVVERNSGHLAVMLSIKTTIAGVKLVTLDIVTNTPGQQPSNNFPENHWNLFGIFLESFPKKNGIFSWGNGIFLESFFQSPLDFLFNLKKFNFNPTQSIDRLKTNLRLTKIKFCTNKIKFSLTHKILAS